MKKIIAPVLGLVIGACSAHSPNSDPRQNGGDGDGTQVGDGDGDQAGDGDGTPVGDGDGDQMGDGDGAGGSGDGDGDVVSPPLPDGTSSAAALPARIRRLTNAEYNAAVQQLLGTTLSPADDFPPDSRQHGYTLNEAQRVDPVLARKLDTAAALLAEQAVGALATLAPCADPSGQAESCAASFIESFATRAYRRPLSEEDRTSLLALYRAGASDSTYADGVQLVIRGILQSPGFLYLTELGDGGEGLVTMSPYEMAASLSFLLTGGPPDDELLRVAQSGELASSEQRRMQAERLLQKPEGRRTAVRLVKEWLGIDRIVATSKDSTVYPEFQGLQASMAQETEDFVLATLDSSRGSLDDLLGATWTVANADLATMYGAGGQGRVQVPGRPGLLNRAAFLSVFAHAHESAPVLRGTGVIRRILCGEMELPTDLTLELVPPVPDPTLTTRERFAIHSQDPGCAKCHRTIDPLGFSFEQFDGMGKHRQMEHGTLPIDSTATVAIGADFDGSYASSSDLALAISQSAEARTCFARQVLRAGAGESQNIKKSEDAFVASLEKLSAEDQRSLVSLLVSLAGSDIMIYRRQP